MKSVVLIGSGNLAEALALALSRTEGIALRQLYARNPQRGAALAARTGTAWCATPDELLPADLYIIAVSDVAIGDVAASLSLPERATVVHTSGATPVEVIPHPRRGVLYPLQTFTAGRTVDFRTIPLFIEGSTPEVTSELEGFARTLSDCVQRANAAQRQEIHLAGVLTCNFVNHLYTVAGHRLQAAGIDPTVLRPLLAETAAKALSATDPAQMQTGPARRGDRLTLERHEQQLANYDRLRTIYRLISENIWEISKKTL